MSGSGASLFGLAIPAFAAIDGMMSTALGPLIRVIVWGALMAVLTMILYRLISPQRRLAVLRSQSAASRQRLADYDGELEGLWPLAGESLKLSLRQISTILGPGLLASLPLVACLVWLDSAFGYRAPQPDQGVSVEIFPQDETIQARPAGAVVREDDAWQVRWPPRGTKVQLLDRQANVLVALQGTPGSHLVERRQWWNVFVGNPLGYLPERSQIERLEFGFAPLELHDFGPPWMRGWATPFFTSLILLSIAIKFVFRIE